MYDSPRPSLESDTYATSATSVSSATNVAAKPDRELRRTCGAISASALQLAMVLECLNDMVVQENAQIEKCLRDVTESVSGCVGYNTFTVPRRRIYPKGR